MKHRVFSAEIFFVVLCFFAIAVQCQLQGSGSGDGVDDEDRSNTPPTVVIPAHGDDDKDDRDDQEIGSGTEVSTTTKTVLPLNTDDEDSDKDDENRDIIYSGDDVEGSGDDVLPRVVLPQSLNKNVRCSSSNLYCWCVDEAGDEIPKTRQFVDDSGSFNCVEDIVIEPLVQPTKTTTKKVTIPFRMIDTTTAKKKTTPKIYTTVQDPYTKPSDATKRIGAGTADKRKGDDDDVQRERVFPLFTHPGILAAIIGGGVVALLCALLLVMFVVYRMKKKDEGSYPLDPDAKPPRLHTYTRAPNKEFYA